MIRTLMFVGVIFCCFEVATAQSVLVQPKQEPTPAAPQAGSQEQIPVQQVPVPPAPPMEQQPQPQPLPAVVVPAGPQPVWFIKRGLFGHYKAKPGWACPAPPVVVQQPVVRQVVVNQPVVRQVIVNQPVVRNVVVQQPVVRQVVTPAYYYAPSYYPPGYYRPSVTVRW